MITRNASTVWEPYIACQCRLYEKAKASHCEKLAAPFVTISRQAGAGGITIGEKLAAYLREHDQKALCPWVVFDRNLVTQVLAEHNLPREFEEFMPEDKISEIQDMIEELFKLHPAQWTLVHKTSETILHLAQMGNVILVGRGANVITRKFLKIGFHVRLVGSLEKRIRHIQEYYGFTRDQAADFIQKEDSGRKHYLKRNFDKEIDDPLLYDLMVNTDFIPYDEAAKMIGQTVLSLRTGS